MSEKNTGKAFYRKAERVALWLESLKLGTSYKSASTILGVNYQSVLDALCKGRSELCEDEDLKLFAQQTDAAIKEFEERNLDIIKKAAERDWKAAAWLLERRMFDVYAKRDISVDDSAITKTAKITVEYVDSNSKEVEDRISAMEQLIKAENEA